jgi:hypothetical protein
MSTRSSGSCHEHSFAKPHAMSARSSPPAAAGPRTVVSYRIVSYRIVSYRIVSYRIVSYRIVSCRVVSCCVVLCRIVSCRIASYCIVSCRIAYLTADIARLFGPRSDIRVLDRGYVYQSTYRLVHPSVVVARVGWPGRVQIPGFCRLRIPLTTSN